MGAPIRAGSPTRLRVLHLNIYGRARAHCEDRYREIARRILTAEPPYDVVSLNEHWRSALGNLFGISCDSEVLTRALLADGRYRDNSKDERTRFGYPRGHWLQTRGGNSVLTLHTIADFQSERFSNSNSHPVSGYMKTGIRLSPERTVDVWSTHLESGSDHCDDACRRKQYMELATAIQTSGSTRPTLILGDFNVNGPVPASAPGLLPYVALQSALRPYVDQFTGEEGYTWDPKTNALITGRTRERIDYLFARPEIRVLKFETTHWTTPLGTPVSDHYGLDVTLEIP